MPKRISKVTSVYRRVACDLNRYLREKGYTHRINPLQLVSISKKYSGRCAYCGVNCIPQAKARSTRMYFSWYIPLTRGGEPVKENLVPVCSEHLYAYRPTKQLRETIPDINTFSDLVHRLVQAVIKIEQLKSDNNTEAFIWAEKARRIKRLLNSLIEDIVTSTQYHPFTDWKIEDGIVHEDGVNTIPDMIENAAINEIEKKEPDSKPLTESIKQILYTKQYKVIKKHKE